MAGSYLFAQHAFSMAYSHTVKLNLNYPITKHKTHSFYGLLQYIINCTALKNTIYFSALSFWSFPPSTFEHVSLNIQSQKWWVWLYATWIILQTNRKNDSTSQRSCKVSCNKPATQSSTKSPMKCSISDTQWLITAGPAVASAVLDKKALFSEGRW